MIRNGFSHAYEDIISVENLLNAWKSFLSGKRARKDVLEFERDLMKNIFSLYEYLRDKKYIHGGYQSFNISDPKPRIIHKAAVRDRLVHHLIHNALCPYFDSKFIHDSYSCRIGKGTHKAIYRFEDFARRASKNYTRTCWVLKCDIRKFFASIDHDILKSILLGHIEDAEINRLLERVIDSFNTEGRYGKGLPLGNLTSQLLANVYMNEFDWFVKRKLKHKYYIRYADDFVFMSDDRRILEAVLIEISDFLDKALKLFLNESKVSIRTVASGVDFLGWVHFVRYRVLRTTTKKRMFRNIKYKKGKSETVQSYLGMLKYGNARRLSREVAILAKKFKKGIRDRNDG